MTNRAAGWTSWLMEEPPKGVLIRVWQEYTDAEWTGYAEDVTPSGCLWWKYTALSMQPLQESDQCSGLSAGAADARG
jgi:hypothetical protein